MSEEPQPTGPGRRKDLSVVIPCYNEEQILRETFLRMREVCERAVEGSYEIVLVNDGSTDGTREIMYDLIASYPETVCVNLSRNHGHQLALTAGLSIACGERVMIIDADLQDPPELLGVMMDKMDDGADVVYGQRRRRPGENVFKLWTAKGFYWLINKLSDTTIPSEAGDFRLLSRRVVDAIIRMPERHRFLRGMVAWVGFRQEAITYDRQERRAGETKYSTHDMAQLAVNAITSFSVRPLTMTSWIAFAMGLVALGLFVYSLLSWLLADTVAGWTSLMAGMALLGSIQLFVLWIFGEYLGRIYEETKRRPLFIVEEVERGDQRGADVSDRQEKKKASRP